MKSPRHRDDSIIMTHCLCRCLPTVDALPGDPRFIQCAIYSTQACAYIYIYIYIAHHIATLASTRKKTVEDLG
ncbi:hypothetical protein BDV24DRAFT_130527, partial [Aspergillus arachidicola]